MLAVVRLMAGVLLALLVPGLAHADVAPGSRSPGYERRDVVAPKRPDPRRPPRPTLADKLAALPAPPQAKVTYGDFTLPSGLLAGGYTNTSTGEIFLRDRPKRPRKDFGLGHEMFHLLDAQSVTDADRSRWQGILGLKGAWNQGTGATAGGLVSPSEIAADYFGAIAIGLDPLRQMEGGYVGSYDPRKMRRFANSLERFRKRNNLSVLDLANYG